MDLREKIAEAIRGDERYPARAELSSAESIVDAVMGVVEEETRRQHQDAKCVPYGAYQRVCGLLTEAEAEAGAANARVRALEDESQRMRERLRAVSLIKAWTNEDGKGFVFTDDLLVALGHTTPAVLSRAREIAEEKA